MAYINVFIENQCSLNVKNNQLIIKNDNTYTYPLEDINSMIIDNNYCNLSMYLINKIAENHIMLYFCNEKHLPTAQIMNINTYSRKIKRIKEQYEIQKPLQKQLWQSIIKQKITNQSKCLELLNIKNHEKLNNMINKVQSGDVTNVEATAASLYFTSLFGNSFTRGSDNIINSCLNYGYAIIRGMIARSIIVHGLEPAIGLFHHNELNNFNLADDLIEPFRPFVDLYIVKNIPLETNELNTSIKKIILNITNQILIIDNKKYSIHNAIEYMVMSYTKSLSERRNYLFLPEIRKIEEYSFL